MPALPGEVTHADDSAAQQAAREIADARERANAAADAYFQAESLLDTLSIEGQDPGGRGGRPAIASQPCRSVCNRWPTTASPAATPPHHRCSTGSRRSEEQMQVAALSEVITDTSAADFDEFDSLNRQLTKSAAGAHRQARPDRAAEGHCGIVARPGNGRGGEPEEGRGATPAGRSGPEGAAGRRNAPAAKAEAEAAKLQQATANTAEIDNPTDADGGGGAPQTTAPPADAGSGGQTGGGGAGGRPGGAGGNDYGGVEWVCPTGTAVVAFGDTWGAPRSGRAASPGRRHDRPHRCRDLGRGVDGVAAAKSNTLGGTTIWFTGSDGNKYYYAHLDHYGKLGRSPKATSSATWAKPAMHGSACRTSTSRSTPAAAPRSTRTPPCGLTASRFGTCAGRPIGKAVAVTDVLAAALADVLTARFGHRPGAAQRGCIATPIACCRRQSVDPAAATCG